MICLTNDEIYELTEFKRPADQIKWLEANGYRYDVSRAGRPKVSRAYYESRQGIVSKLVQPDFSFLEKAA